jgi:hypothetical protein
MVRHLFRALAWSTILAVPVFGAQGCSSSDITGVADNLCCKDFKVGADLTNVDWGISGDGKVEFGAFMQASGDFTAAATATVSDLTAACQALAVDLGAKEDAVTETAPGQRAIDWCTTAAAQIKVAAGGSISIVAQPPTCTVSASVQGSCEAKCSANASCEVTPAQLTARCSGGVSGKCTGECSGSCQGSANVAVTCEGSCSGTCEGSCDGTCSGGLSGTCSGMCTGTCDGKSTGGAAASCAGNCDGTCSVAFTNPVCKGSCSGSCAGKCRGTCTAAADAKLQCEGECSGSCSVEIQAPKCNGTLKPPSAECQGSADCSGSCSASANAKAECTPGSLEITAAGGLSVQAQASLKTNLPKILAIFQARGKILVDTGTAVATLGVNVTGKAPGFSAKAALCVVPAVEAIAEAATNAGASFEASGKIAGAIGM